MDKNYQFIQSVDPSKCHTVIKEKFAKLTLSSNKKKQKTQIATKMDDDSLSSNALSRASRSLLPEFECDISNKGNEQLMESENLLLRSSPESFSIDAGDVTHCSAAEENSNLMEPLMVSGIQSTENRTEAADEIDRLTSRISRISVQHSYPDLPATSIDYAQRPSNDLNTSRTPFKLVQCISLSSTEDESQAITISDSSEDEDNDVMATSPCIDTTPRITTTESGKAERLAAFLSDVGRNAGRYMEMSSQDISTSAKNTANADTLSMLGFSIREADTLHGQMPNVESEPGVAETDSRTMNTDQQIAVADTESMTLTSRNATRNRLLQSLESADDELANDTDSNNSDDSIREANATCIEDSITIAETSDEEEQTENTPKIVNRVKPNATECKVAHISPFHINISAKFNIKIQMSGAFPNSADSSSQSEYMSAENSSSTAENETESSPKANAEEQTGISESCDAQKSANKKGGLQIESGNSMCSPVQQPSPSPKQCESSPVHCQDDPATRSKEVSSSYGQDEFPPERRTLSSPEYRKRVDSDLMGHSPPSRLVQSTSDHRDDSPQDRQDLSCSQSQELKNHIPLDEPKTPQNNEGQSQAEPKALSSLENQEVKRGDLTMDFALRVLNEVYGNTWKTPEAINTLRCITTASNKKVKPARPNPEKDDVENNFQNWKTPLPVRSRNKIAKGNDEKIESDIQWRTPRPPSPLKDSKGAHASEMSPSDSVLKDFSIFRKEIPQGLESTRLQMCDASPFVAGKGKSSKSTSTTLTPISVSTTRSGRTVRKRLPVVVDDRCSSGEDSSYSVSSGSDDSDNEIKSKTRKPGTGRKHARTVAKKPGELVYMDLTKNEVEIQNDSSASPPANHDPDFNQRLELLLNNGGSVSKPTPASSRRKLFTIQWEDEENIPPPPENLKTIDKKNGINENITFHGVPLPARFTPLNKHLESVKLGHPIFKTPLPKQNPQGNSTPTSVRKYQKPSNIVDSPSDTYGFLKSLDVCVSQSMSHPDAVIYKENFRTKKDELAKKLYELYNSNCFDNKLDVLVVWNKKLTNTAGRCMNKKRQGQRTSTIELSEKVLTSADRLRCTLIHELCHAATWIFDGEHGHGAVWKSWARKANEVFPELPKIGVCHQYEIEYKYTYQCTLCGAKSFAHSKSKKVDSIRCSYCHGGIEVFLNKKDKEGNILATPTKEPTAFAKFVKDKYREFKKPGLKHAEVMKLLSNEYAALKVSGK